MCCGYYKKDSCFLNEEEGLVTEKPEKTDSLIRWLPDSPIISISKNTVIRSPSLFLASIEQPDPVCHSQWLPLSQW